MVEPGMRLQYNVEQGEQRMPIYDYLCRKCRKRFQISLSYAEYGTVPVTCTYCGSEDVQRRIGRVRIRTGGAGPESWDDSTWENLDQEDPKALASMMRSMSREMGEDLPPELDEVVDRLEAGEDPEAIEKDLPLDDDGLDF